MNFRCLSRLALLSALLAPSFIYTQVSMKEQDLDQVIPIDLFRDPKKEREERQRQKALHRREREQQRKWRQVAEEIEKRQQNREQYEDKPAPTMGELAEEDGIDYEAADAREQISALTVEMEALRLRIRANRSRAVYFQREALRLGSRDYGTRARVLHEARLRTRRVQALQASLEELEERRTVLQGKVEH